MFGKLSINGRALYGIVFIITIIGGGPLFAQRPDVAAGRYFVGFQRPISANDRALLVAQGAALGGAFPEVNAVEIILRDAGRLNAILRNPNVSYVEAVPMRYPLDLADTQLTPSLNNGLYGLITTKAVDVHARGVTGFGVNVGVADTGIDYTHPDIAPNYRGGTDTVGDGDDDPSWNMDPEEIHGTHVAGILAGANDSGGILGVAYSANLYHARVLGPDGGTTTDIMEGVRWLVEEADCKVVNLSLGGRLRSRTEEMFYNAIRNQGVLVVAASGNEAAKRVSFPAGYPSNIAVGAVDRNNLLADFSNRGRNLDIVAPGVFVLSSVGMNAGSEAAVVADATHTAYGLEFAAKTTGVTGLLISCGLGGAGECPASVAGNIALIQRGGTSFAEKVTNAMDQGAAAAVIYNNASGDFLGTLGTPKTADDRDWIPAISVSDVTGAALVTQLGTTATVVNKVSSWDLFDGTSMATPHVTGILALIWSADPSLANSTVESYLLGTAEDLGASGYDTAYGHGLVNASAAVARTGH